MPLNFISATWQLLEIQWGLIVFCFGTQWGNLQYIRRTSEPWWCSDSPLAVICYITLSWTLENTNICQAKALKAAFVPWQDTCWPAPETRRHIIDFSLSSCMTACSSNDSRNNMHLSTSLSSFVTLSSEFWCCSSLSVAPRWRNSVMVGSICWK